MLKIALLYFNKGYWERNQILPAKWIEDSFQSHIKCDGQDNGKEYSYQFWIRHDTINNKPFKIVAAQGNGDQRIYFDKTHRLLVIFTAGNYNNENIANDSYAVLQDYIFTSLIKK
jgi:hypothetical protein